MKASMPSRHQPPHAAQKPLIWFALSGVRMTGVAALTAMGESSPCWWLKGGELYRFEGRRSKVEGRSTFVQEKGADGKPSAPLPTYFDLRPSNFELLEGQPESELRRPHLRACVLQELGRHALCGANAPVRTVEHIEDLRD